MNAAELYQRELRALPRCWTRLCGSEPQGEMPTLEELDGFVAEMSQRDDLQLETLEDGCYARSQVLAAELRQRGIRGSKVFVQSLLRPLRAEDEDEKVAWNYHVAPVVVTRVGERLEPRVVDPQSSSRSQTLAEWMGGFRQKQFVIVTIHDDTKYQNGLGGSKDFPKNLERARRDLRRLG